ncbi:unnamed protein product [Rotaria socialis]|uniref:Uncharacterized protein n=1 Tax=Rotaria socialis TaxID=392032 RepID=A0A821SC86_9BILA|nr:unnamed protein product [Rotaria socialis]
MKEYTHRIDEKLDRINDKVNQTALYTELHQATLEKLLPICASIVCDFIWPVMAQNVAGLGDKHSQLQKILSNADLLLCDLKSDYSVRRKHSTSPPRQLPPSKQPKKSPNITTNNELEQNMSKIDEYQTFRFKKIQTERTPLNIPCCNVQGWGSDALSLWNTSRVPLFNIFHQHGTNNSEGVCVAIGKHLKGTRIEVNVENAVIIDVNGFSETIRVIAFYWPAGQLMMLDDLEPYLIENTIITSDFNASIKEVET